ncbi:hypothetical protein MNBD_GAMMA17-2144 [hydrothermal vent metagenome]|uniref:Uncharacterized protein n=1 Tax=hydrothermal vent metagenome TaxID=652676 RepID=A0A3B0ZBU5_9ZZZZ
MSTRIENVPKLRTVPASINAELYNIALLATLRLEAPLRIRLPGLRTIDVVINRNAWICLDRTMYDLPALAWTHINQKGRNALHTPVDCELHYYHIHANISAHKVLTSLYGALEEVLENAASSQPGKIIVLPLPK